MLQENYLTGLFLLIGLAIGDPTYAIAAFLASAIGMFTARLLKFKTENIEAGLYGFSPALVGVGLLVMIGNSPVVWLMIIIGSILAAFIQQWFISKNLPGYTFPFIIVTWILYFIYYQFNSSPIILTSSVNVTVIEWMPAFFNSFGQVIFQGDILIGFFFFLAITISSFRSVRFASLGVAISFVMVFIVDLTTFNAGFWGFNAVLTAIALSTLPKNIILWTIIGVILTLAIQYLLISTNLLKAVGGILTFPFVSGTWVALYLYKKLQANPY